jgi:hypothetical protein
MAVWHMLRLGTCGTYHTLAVGLSDLPLSSPFDHSGCLLKFTFTQLEVSFEVLEVSTYVLLKRVWMLLLEAVILIPIGPVALCHKAAEQSRS